jgi:hypothetical protein
MAILYVLIDHLESRRHRQNQMPARLVVAYYEALSRRSSISSFAILAAVLIDGRARSLGGHGASGARGFPVSMVAPLLLLAVVTGAAPSPAAVQRGGRRRPLPGED